MPLQRLAFALQYFLTADYCSLESVMGAHGVFLEVGQILA